MACSPPAPDAQLSVGSELGFSLEAGSDSASGFASPAAMIVSLAIATVAVVVQVRATQAMRAGELEYARTHAELALEGVQVITAGRLLQGGVPVGELNAGEGVIARAEPEAAKLSPALAARLDPSALAALGASQPSVVKTGLVALGSQPDADPEAIRTLDPSPLWRACARSVISPSGLALAITPPPPGSAREQQAHPGEVWRLTARDPSGWSEDRTVRITGDAAEPARVIDRRFFRHPAEGPPCPTLALTPSPPSADADQETPATP